jgi:hypothetical protein
LLAECQQAEAGANGSMVDRAPRERALEFLAERPGSVYSERIRGMCEIAGSDVVKPGAEGSERSGH